MLCRLLILSMLFFNHSAASYAIMQKFILENKILKRVEDMSDEEFDELCDDAVNMAGNGYRDSKDAAKEAGDYE